MLQASDELTSILNKYVEVIEKGHIHQDTAGNLALLDLATSPLQTNDKLQDSNKDMDLLCDIFDNATADATQNILKPTSLARTNHLGET